MKKPNISNGEAFCLLLFMDSIHIQYFLISLHRKTFIACFPKMFVAQSVPDGEVCVPVCCSAGPGVRSSASCHVISQGMSFIVPK